MKIITLLTVIIVYINKYGIISYPILFLLFFTGIYRIVRIVKMNEKYMILKLLFYFMVLILVGLIFLFSIALILGG
jgi:hypothetical protein